MMNVCIGGRDCRMAAYVVGSQLTLCFLLRQSIFTIYYSGHFCFKSYFPPRFCLWVGRHLTVLPSEKYDLLFEAGS